MSTVILPADLQPGTISVARAAARLGIATATAYDLIKRNDFPVRVLQIGGRMKVSVVELERYLAGDPDFEELALSAEADNDSPTGRDAKAGWSTYCRRGEADTCERVQARCSNPLHTKRGH